MHLTFRTMLPRVCPKLALLNTEKFAALGDMFAFGTGAGKYRGTGIALDYICVIHISCHTIT